MSYRRREAEEEDIWTGFASLAAAKQPPVHPLFVVARSRPNGPRGRVRVARIRSSTVEWRLGSLYSFAGGYS